MKHYEKSLADIVLKNKFEAINREKINNKKKTIMASCGLSTSSGQLVAVYCKIRFYWQIEIKFRN